MKVTMSLLLRTAILFLSAISLSFSQQGTATISGTVTDPQDAAIGGATVHIRNVGTGAETRAVTNDSGFYTAPGVAVGEYEVSVQQQGFKSTVQRGITVQVGQNAAVNIRLELGQTSESVQVSAEVPLVDTGSATVGQVIENRRVTDLPINGRNALALTLLNPGVVSNAGPTQSGFGDRGVDISSLSINGSPNGMNAQMLDGANNVLSFVGEVGIPPAVDSVEEFRVQSGAMSSEFGFTAGGAINLVTKSGTNDFHGTLYEFLRNDKFDARNAFAVAKLPLRYNQYGGSIGGPIIRNRTFGFFNYEEYKLSRSTPRISTTPLDEWRRGDFSNLRDANGNPITIYDPATTRPNTNGAGLIRDPFPGNRVPSDRFDPVAVKILDFWPQPNRTPTNPFTQSNNFQDASLTKVDWSQLNTRIDHLFSQNNSFFFRYTDASHRPSGNNIFTDPTVGSNREDDQTNRNIAVSDTHTFGPSLINNLRVSAMRQSFVFAAINAGRDWVPKLGLPSNIPNIQFPQINFGFGTIGGQAVGRRGSMNWDIQDMVTWIKGSHTVKIGYNHRINQGSNTQGSALSGDFAFSGLTTNPQVPAGTGNNLAQFLLGEVSTSFIDSILGATWVNYSASAFIQDDWKVNRRLTLNLGLRYDFQQRPIERNNGHINFIPTERDPVSGLMGRVVYAGVDGQPRSFLNEDRNDWGPRAGLAWDVFGSGRTVFRAGYGLFYPSIFFRTYFGDTQLFSSTRTNYVAQGPGLRAFRLQDGFPFALLQSPGPAAGPSALLGQSVSYREPENNTPMSHQWDASIQQQLGRWLVDVTYSGNKGTFFAAGGYNLNQLDPALRLQLGQSLNDPVPNPYAGLVPGGLGAATITRERALMPFPYYNSVNVSNPPIGNFISHLLLINVRRQFSNGFLVNVAFTGGKKISDNALVPIDFGAIEQATENGWQNALYNRAAERSIDPADVSRRLVVSLLYELPVGPGKVWIPGNAVVRHVLGGWQTNVILLSQTGIPLTVRGANNFQANRPNSTGVSAKIDNPTAQRWFDTDQFVNPPNFTFGNVGRTLPDVRHPGTFNIDFSLIKNTRITERVNLQLRGEAFNVTNTVNLRLVDDQFVAGPNGRNASATFGTVNSSRDARVIQVGLKLIF